MCQLRNETQKGSCDILTPLLELLLLDPRGFWMVQGEFSADTAGKSLQEMKIKSIYRSIYIYTYVYMYVCMYIYIYIFFSLYIYVDLVSRLYPESRHL